MAVIRKESRLSTSKGWFTIVLVVFLSVTGLDFVVNNILYSYGLGFSYTYNRRIAGAHGHFTIEDYQKWLKKAETKDLAQALTRLAQLNQSKVYLFW